MANAQQTRLSGLDYIRLFGFFGVVYAHSSDWTRWTSTGGEEFTGLNFRYRVLIQMLGVFFFISAYSMPRKSRLTYKKLITRSLSLLLFFVLGLSVVTPIFLIRGQLSLYHLWFLGILLGLNWLLYGSFRLSFFHGPVDIAYALLGGITLAAGGAWFQVGAYGGLGPWTPIRVGAFVPLVVYILFCLRACLPWWVLLPTFLVADAPTVLALVPFPTEVWGQGLSYYIAAPMLAHSLTFMAGFWAAEHLSWLPEKPLCGFLGPFIALFVILPGLPVVEGNIFMAAGVVSYPDHILMSVMLSGARQGLLVIFYFCIHFLNRLPSGEFLQFSGMFIYIFHPIFVWGLSNLIRSALNFELRLLIYWASGLGGSALIAWVALLAKRHCRCFFARCRRSPPVQYQPAPTTEERVFSPEHVADE